MRSRNWVLIFIVCALVGVVAGYFVALWLKPGILPPALRLGFVREPKTILFLGTDVVYTIRSRGRGVDADNSSFSGRSDTIMVAHLDPYRNSFSVLSIPRDTLVRIPGHGKQKINAANALGGPELACRTISQLLQMKVESYVVLNVKGLEELVDEIGGITINVPKRMKYTDRSAGLFIDLYPGPVTLSGSEAMGFVRFRHDGLGDIGRVQRQELFVQAVLDKAVQPQTWSHVPRLIEIARQFIATNIGAGELTSIAAFVKGVPKENQRLVMLPGRFADSGDWEINVRETRKVVAQFTGSTFVESDRAKLIVTVCNVSRDRKLGNRILKTLNKLGYKRVRLKQLKDFAAGSTTESKFIAQKGNSEDAEMVKKDLGGIGHLVNASVGDIESAVTIVAADDLLEDFANTDN